MQRGEEIIFPRLFFYINEHVKINAYQCLHILFGSVHCDKQDE